MSVMIGHLPCTLETANFTPIHKKSIKKNPQLQASKNKMVGVIRRRGSQGADVSGFLPIVGEKQGDGKWEVVDFGSGPDADPAYWWHTLRELFSLADVCALPSAVLILP